MLPKFFLCYTVYYKIPIQANDNKYNVALPDTP